ncbi:MAG: electron transfer flavoprotein beta subunit/FixA family protein [Calditrichaeota bacterium]|nr:MAG: electron transfer flavoprotein beta subunit/FixA family protein [Calditrichota bacterium]
MNIAICVKEVPDTETRPKLKDDNQDIQREGIKWIVNPYDEFAIELGLQLTEKHGGEVTIVSLGPKEIEPTIRSALAMGAQKAIRLDGPRTINDPLTTARVLAKVLKEKNYDLILFGKQAIDDDHAQVPQMVSEALELPCATVVVKLEVDGEQAYAEREIEGGKEKLAFSLPAVLSCQKGLNEPRYRSLKGIMAAKKVTIEEVKPELDSQKLSIKKLSFPPEKKPGRIVGEGVEAVPELVQLLKDEAKVI